MPFCTLSILSTGWCLFYFLFQGTLDGGRIGIAGQALGIAQVFWFLFFFHSYLASSIEKAINMMDECFS